MEGWDGNADWSRDVLEHIVALLFALAGLADLAADLPFLRRRQMLGILSHGEGAARAFVAGAGAPAPVDGPVDDAARLAASFRALALALCALLAQSALSACPHAAGPGAGREKPAEAAGRQALPLAPDTS
jgi:hypothetical protein